MSRENVEIVRRIYDAYAQGDIEEALTHLDPEIDWSEPPQSPGGSSPYRGQEGARRSLNAWIRAWDDYRGSNSMT